MADPTAADLGFELLPADDDGVPPDADLDAAESSALEEPELAPEEPPVPFGLTWLFDYEAGRFVRDGSSPKEVRGLDTLAVWCGMAAHTARFAHPIFSANFGTERPDDVLGEAADAQEIASDWAERLRESLSVHDRVASVDLQTFYDMSTGTLYVSQLEVVTDAEDEDPLRLAGLSVGNVGS